jgi:hypothetical protein
MLIKNTIALSVAAVLISASAAMAATTHHSRRATAPRQAAQDQVEQDAAYGSAARWQNQGRPSFAAGPFYYEPEDNGSPFAYYPGYTTR